MLSRHDPHFRAAEPATRRIAAETIGCRVARTGRGGRVAAVFAHACNLAMDDGALVTVLAGKAGRVAHGIRLPGELPRHSALRAGTAVHIDAQRLVFFAVPFRVILSTARVWTPDLRIGMCDRNEGARNAAAFVRKLLLDSGASRVSEFLAAVLRPSQAPALVDRILVKSNHLADMAGLVPAISDLIVRPSPVYGAARGIRGYDAAEGEPTSSKIGLAARVSALLQQIELATRDRNRATARGAVAQLIGLGPGLTPAGDDFIIGWLAGLTLTATTPGRQQVLHAMCSAVQGLRFATTSVSSQHLDDACALMFSERLSDLCTAIAAGAPPPVLAARAAAQLAVGATSGADAAAGLMFALFDCGALTGKSRTT